MAAISALDAIRHTIAAYTIAGDNRDGAAFLALFAPGGVFEFSGFPPIDAFRYQGHDELRQRTAGWSAVPGEEASLRWTSFIRHNVTTSEITLTGTDTARARTYFVVFSDCGPDHSGVYDDDLVRHGDGWLFAHRRISLDWRSPTSVFPALTRAAGLAHHDPHQANVDLMNRYAHALDTRDWALFEGLFMPDARFAARQWDANAVPGPWDFELAGREAIVGMIRTVWDGLSATHHMLSNHVVDPAQDGKSARGSCYLRAHHIGNRKRGQLFEESLGRFDFETVRDGPVWKIAALEENIMIMLGTAAAFAPPE